MTSTDPAKNGSWLRQAKVKSITRAAIPAHCGKALHDDKAYCRYFIPPLSPASNLGQCEKVAGPINKLYWCRLFARALFRLEVAPVLFRQAQFYHREFLKNNPGSGVGLGAIMMSTLRALEGDGCAEKHVNADGVTWRTAKFLAQVGGEPGPLVSFGPGMH